MITILIILTALLSIGFGYLIYSFKEYSKKIDKIISSFSYMNELKVYDYEDKEALRNMRYQNFVKEMRERLGNKDII